MSGRIRSLKPEILEDAITAGLSDTAFRLFIAFIVLSDDYGHFRAEPGWLRGQVYWSRDVDSKVFAGALDELAPLIQFYLVNGQRYGAVRNWSKHQRVDKPGKPRIPGPPEVDEDTPETLAKPSRDVRDSLVPDLGSRISDLGGGEGPGIADRLVEPERPSRVRRVKPAAEGTLIPPDWAITPHMTAWAKGKGVIEHDVHNAAERFLNHWLTTTNDNAVKRNWDRAFQAWVLGDIEKGKIVVQAVAKPRPKVDPPTPEQIELRRASSATIAAAIAEMDARAGGAR